MTKRLLLGLAPSLFLAHAASAGEMRETWEHRVLETIQQLGSKEQEFGPAALRLRNERSAVEARAATLREQVKAARKSTTNVCAKSDDEKCLDARATAQEAHLQFTENVNDRLQLEVQLVDHNFRYSLEMAGVIANALGDLEKQKARPESAGAARAVADAESRVANFMARAMPALQVAAQYNEAVARSSADQARLAGARDVAHAIRRFRDRLDQDGTGRAPLDRLRTLQARFEAFAGIARQAKHAFQANATALRGINAIAAASLAENMIASYEGGLTKYGQELTQRLDRELPQFQEDIGLLYDAVDGSEQSAGESFFGHESSFFTD